MWYMKPVHVAIEVPHLREDVFAFLDVMANHEPFTNHILREWQYSGSERGVGAKARVKTAAAGRTDTIEIEVVTARPPEKIVEQNIGAGGRRIANGTYTLTELPDGGTRIEFEYAWQQAPLSERLVAPLIRAILRRANERAMQRLSQELAGQPEAGRPAPAQVERAPGNM